MLFTFLLQYFGVAFSISSQVFIHLFIHLILEATLRADPLSKIIIISLTCHQSDSLPRAWISMICMNSDAAILLTTNLWNFIVIACYKITYLFDIFDWFLFDEKKLFILFLKISNSWSYLATVLKYLRIIFWP